MYRVIDDYVKSIELSTISVDNGFFSDDITVLDTAVISQISTSSFVQTHNGSVKSYIGPTGPSFINGPFSVSTTQTGPTGSIKLNVSGDINTTANYLSNGTKIPINRIGWEDITSSISVKGVGQNNPVWTQFASNSPFWGYLMNSGKEVWCNFHIPHSYYPSSTEMYIHVHYTTNGTSENAVNWKCHYSYAKGWSSEEYAVNSSSSSVLSTSGSTINLSSIPRGVPFSHTIAQFENIHPESLGIETDGIMLVKIVRDTDTNPDNVFLMFCDIHYQSFNPNTTSMVPPYI
jgi:hypothetical protein